MSNYETCCSCQRQIDADKEEAVYLGEHGYICSECYQPSPSQEKTESIDYVKQGGTICPHCGAGRLNLEVLDVEFFVGGLYASMQCAACKDVWVEEYTLTRLVYVT